MVVKAEPVEKRFWGRVNVGEPNDCWEWRLARTGEGYGQVRVGSYTNNTRRSVGAHRVAWALENGAIPEGLWVLHHCDNKACCNPAHLYLGTIVENGRDSAMRVRMRRGADVNTAKLASMDVRDIRRRYAAGELQQSLADEYSVTQTTISSIVLRKSWAWLED